MFKSILAITYSFILSWSPIVEVTSPSGVAMFSVNDTNLNLYSNSTYTSFQLGVDVIDHISLYCGESSNQVPDNSFFNWKPYQQTYWLGIAGYWEVNESLRLEGGLRHTCSHPVESWGKKLDDYNYASTELYISISGKIPIF